MNVPSINQLVVTAIAVEAFDKLSKHNPGSAINLDSVAKTLGSGKLLPGSSVEHIHNRIAGVWGDPVLASAEDAYAHFNDVVSDDQVALDEISRISDACAEHFQVLHGAMSHLTGVAGDIVDRIDHALLDTKIVDIDERSWIGMDITMSSVSDLDMVTDAYRYVAGMIPDTLDVETLNHSDVRRIYLTRPMLSLTTAQREYLHKRLSALMDISMPLESLFSLMGEENIRVGFLPNPTSLVPYQEFLQADDSVAALWNTYQAVQGFYDHLPEDDLLREAPYGDFNVQLRAIAALSVVYLNRVYAQTGYSSVAIYDYDSRYVFLNPSVINFEERENDVQIFLRLKSAQGEHPRGAGWGLQEIEDVDTNAARVKSLREDMLSNAAMHRGKVADDIIDRELTRAAGDLPQSPMAASLRKDCQGDASDLPDRILKYLVHVTDDPSLVAHHDNLKEKHQAVSISEESFSTAVNYSTFDALVSTAVRASV